MKMMKAEDPHWLFTQYQQRSNILIIDCRTLNEYSKGHIEGSINLFIPPLMLRRLKKGNVPLKNFINSDIAKEKFENRSVCERVVLYDEESSSVGLSDESVLQILSKKLCEDNSIAYLNGGFRRFEETFPHLCQCGEGTELNNAMFCLANLTINTDVKEEIPSPMYDQNNNNDVRFPSSKIPNAKDLLFRPDSSGPIEIVPRLYLGNKTDAGSVKLLRRARITHILNVTPDLPNAFEETKEFQYMRLPVQDNLGGDLCSHFPEAFDFIDQALEDGGNVLVHCVGGISRSSTIIVAYLMIKYGFSLNDAYDHVKSKKKNIAPNFNFMGQLLDLDRTRGKYTECFISLPGNISPGSLSTNSDLSAASDDSHDSC